MALPCSNVDTTPIGLLRCSYAIELFPHAIKVCLLWASTCAKNVVSKWQYDIEVFVRISVMEPVILGKKLVSRPVFEHSLLRLVHLQVDFVPNPMVESHDTHKHERASRVLHQISASGMVTGRDFMGALRTVKRIS